MRCPSGKRPEEMLDRYSGKIYSPDKVMKKNLLKFTILFISVLGMSNTVVSSSIADIIDSFPNAEIETVMSIVTLPSLLMIVFAFIGARLSSFISKRKILFLGLTLYIIGGIGPAFSNNLRSILVMRGILGAGFGLFIPLASSLIADFFEGDEMVALMGLQSTFVSIGAMVLGFLAGWLGRLNWHHSFWTYGIGVSVLLLTFFCLPEPERREVFTSGKASWTLPFYLLAVIEFLFLVLIISFFTNISIVIANDGLGDAATSGKAVALFYAAGILSGILFGRLFKLLKSFTASVLFGFTGFGFMMLGISRNTHLIWAASAMVGFGFATLQPYFVVAVTAAVPKQAVTKAIAFLIAIGNLGVFFSPAIFSTIYRLLENKPGRFPMLFTAVCFFVGSLAAIFLKYPNASFLSIRAERSNP